MQGQWATSGCPQSMLRPLTHQARRPAGGSWSGSSAVAPAGRSWRKASIPPRLSALPAGPGTPLLQGPERRRAPHVRAVSCPLLQGRRGASSGWCKRPGAPQGRLHCHLWKYPAQLPLTKGLSRRIGGQIGCGVENGGEGPVQPGRRMCWRISHCLRATLCQPSKSAAVPGLNQCPLVGVAAWRLAWRRLLSVQARSNGTACKQCKLQRSPQLHLVHRHTKQACRQLQRLVPCTISCLNTRQETCIASTLQVEQHTLRWSCHLLQLADQALKPGGIQLQLVALVVNLP